jgi:4'-phosphopantetheinyl transferase
MTVQLACGAVGALLAQAPEGWLSASECARLATLTTARRRDQFTAARWQARWLLAQAVGGDPAAWRLEAPPDAPPVVAGRPELFLSISHSGAWTACALGSAPLGLDLEAPQRQRDIAGLIDLCCTPGERARLAQSADREAAFYELWTVKEAWLKRRGEWIAPSRLQQLDARPGNGALQTWSGDGWRLALCANGPSHWWTPRPPESRTWLVNDLRGAA